MKLEWTSPVRVLGTRVLKPLGGEIYLHIMEYLTLSEELNASERRRILSNMALVCKYFHSLAVPCLYEHLEIDACPVKENLRDSRRSSPFIYERFFDAIVTKQEYATGLSKYVQTATMCAFDDESDYSGNLLQQVMRACLRKRCLDAISLFGNLQSFHFVGPPTLQFFDTVSKMPSLRTLITSDHPANSPENQYMTGQPILSEVTANGLSKLKLETLELRGQEYWPWNTPYIAGCINIREMKRLLAPFEIFKVLVETEMNKKAMLKLETLHLNERPHSINYTDLEKIFNRLPDIVDLEVSALWAVMLESAKEHHIPDDVLPNLKRLAVDSMASLPLVRTLLSSSRPIQEFALRVVNPSFCDYHCDSLNINLSKIRVMELPGDAFRGDFMILKDLSNLESLSLLISKDAAQLYRVDNPIEKMFEVPMMYQHGSLPKLCRLRFLLEMESKNYHAYDLRWQHSLITEEPIPTYFPNLEMCSVTEGIYWHTYNGAHEWRPFVPATYREQVAHMLKSYQYHLDDFDGCYAKIIASSPVSSNIQRLDENGDVTCSS